MLDISALRKGCAVRNLGSGSVYEVIDYPGVRVGTDGQTYWTAPLTRGVECSNPEEWELLAPMQVNAAAGFAVTIDGIRYEAPTAHGIGQLLNVVSDHITGIGAYCGDTPRD